jgi:hypothetical protein
MFFTLRFFRCLQENLGSKQPIFTFLGSFERSWCVDGSYCIFDHGFGTVVCVGFKRKSKNVQFWLWWAITNFFLIMFRLKSWEFSKRAYHSIFNRYLASWVLYVAICFKAKLFRRHKKQFSALFLELDNKWMIEICSNTCDTHLLFVF